jgi:hypothetical protein
MVRKKMKYDLTTGTWQDDTGCPISIILVSTSDVSKKEFPRKLKNVFPPKFTVQQYRLKNTDTGSI